MAMEEGLDTGPVLLQAELGIGLLENGQQLAARLADLTARLLVEAMPRIASAGAGPQTERWLRLGLQPQPDQGVTYARLLRREDALLDWHHPALQLHRRVMGLFPGAYTHWQGRRLKVMATEPLLAECCEALSPEGAELALRAPGWPTATPGEVLAPVEGIGVVVATGEGPLLVREAQIEGKKPCAGSALLQQLGIVQGDLLGSPPGGGD